MLQIINGKKFSISTIYGKVQYLSIVIIIHLMRINGNIFSKARINGKIFGKRSNMTFNWKMFSNTVLSFISKFII